ncbi:signal recognition particle-docking protein FtsY [Clostridiaceae bacterium HSG29]|nr:signal recognition particle-docking protein FtsY [Clostridiaceae bacterium HSG29]
MFKKLFGNKNEETIESEEIVEEVKVEEPIEEPIEELNEEPEIKKESFFQRLTSGLSKTKKGITDKIDNLINNYGEIDDELFEELEEILIMADVGMQTTMDIIDKLRDRLVEKKIKESKEIKGTLKEVISEILKENNNHELISSSPTVMLVIGVNGVGKTTTIGKIAYKLKYHDNKSVLLAAGDTFRAAANEQLIEWGRRSDINVISQGEGSDAAAVIFDAIQSAKAKKVDVLLCDTAGRLHNKKNLMNELNKIFKIIDREYAEANKEVLLVLDATTGQNAISQAKLFSEVADITGLVLTKLDGTAKGGVILPINHELNIPVKLIGVGEGIEDLQVFDPEKFADALFE